MGSTTYENRGAKSTNRPRIDPGMVMTITDPAHPEHVGRNPSHYLPGDSLFDQIVADCLGTIGIIQAPLLIWIVSPKTAANARYWLADKSKAGGGFWRVIEGSKRIEGLREANRQRVAAGGVPLMLEFDADISMASGDKVETLSHVKHVAAQQTRAIESAFTTAFHIATLLGRPWGETTGRNEADLDAVLERIRYRGKRVSKDMAEQALHVTRGFPNASALLIEAMHGGLAWSAALRLSCKAQDEQDEVLTAILKGKAPFLAAGGHPDEFWETVTARDVAAAKTGSFEVPTFVPAVGASETTTEAAPTDGEAPPVKPAPGARPERVKAKPAAPAQPRIKTAVAKAMYEAAQTEIKTATGKALTEMRAVLALLATLAGETADDADQVQSMDRLYKIARTVQE